MFTLGMKFYIQLIFRNTELEEITMSKHIWENIAQLGIIPGINPQISPWEDKV